MFKRKHLILLVLIFSGCSTPEIITSYNTINLSNTQSYINYKNPLIYYLPRNIINVKIEVDKKSFVPGPYAEFAEKLLGIEGVEVEEFIEYEIGNIEIETTAIPDTNQIYVIENENFGKHINFLDLSTAGVLKSINCISEDLDQQVKSKKSYDPKDENEYIPFTDLSIKPNIVEKTERTYSTVKTDTSVIRVPVTKKRIVEKSLEEKAEEAAAFILKLRKRRFKIIAGMYDTHPDGMAVHNMVAELDKLEKEYVSLFIGKTFVKTLNYEFYYDPQPEIDLNHDILFKFSREKGLVEKNEKSRPNIQNPEIAENPVLINVAPITKSYELDEFFTIQKNKFKEKEGFHYREPSLVKIDIIVDMEIVFSQETLMAQYGQLMVLPIDILQDNGIEIRFYEKYGSLKSIKTQ